MEFKVQFPANTVYNTFITSIDALHSYLDASNMVVITDEHVANYYTDFLQQYSVIVLPAGEAQKKMSVIETTTLQLLQMGANRKTILVGFGGGVVTDITGFVAATFMRGIDFTLIPTTLLGMVDAAIGGKNGVNIGVYKNITGTFAQPLRLLFCPAFLETLPEPEWCNGFSEIIKYACIFDASLFQELEKYDIHFFRHNTNLLSNLISQCITFKYNVVLADEKEQGLRKLLNFGHTLGHAIENTYDLSHGEAVAIGMVVAARISEHIVKFDAKHTVRLVSLLSRYKLPTSYAYNVDEVLTVLKNDKKKDKENIAFILLRNIGDAAITPIAITDVKELLSAWM